ncbi:phage portal protein [Clostridium estertheticum]|uniref:phage portal protein n=1 Tax=Clostridium estertheticum TaxID=238834 RepID=UPI001C0E0231|nr:phage portal protein [Clostridium estertheticum]MBU3216655.1 phage portal protein [Clostridium estertheticum]WAG54390.1 phage portal protein [Clostridium estertheticum]
MIFDKLEKRDAVDVNDWKDVYSFEKGYDTTMFSACFQESDYFKCIKIISSDVAKVPLLVKQHTENGERIAKEHPLFDILKNRPNPYMSAVDFFKSMEATRQHNGDSASLIVRNIRGQITGLYPINIVEILIDDVGLLKTKKVVMPIVVTYTCGKDGQQYTARYEDILHFKGFTLDGMTSMCVRKSLKTTLDTNISAKNYQKELFSNGLTSKAVVQLTSDIKDEKELKKTQEKFNRMYSSKGRILTVPAGYSVQPLNLSLTDAEFSVLRKMGTVDTFTAFGVPLYMAGILEGYNNNAMEQATLSFLNDTLQVEFTSIEQEGNYKLLTETDRKNGYYLESDTTYLFKQDSKTLTAILISQVQNGITRPNEARRKLGYDDDVNGDELLLHSGMMPLSMVLNPVVVPLTTQEVKPV